MGKIEDLEKLQHLKEVGALTEIEFENEKKSILNGSISNNITNQGTKEQGKVIIHSYEEFYIGNPNVDVYIDNNLITSLAKGQTYEYPITEVTKITFKSSIRTTNVTVKPNVITEIRLIWNRATGKLEIICNEQTSNEVDNTINKQVYQDELNFKKKFDRVWIAVAIILACIGIGFLLWNAYQGWNKANERNPQIVNSSQSSTFTMEKFNKINTDMTYSQVVNILGTEGSLISQVDNIKTYTWQETNKIISIIFTDNKVSAKSQFGLSGQEQLNKNETKNSMEQLTEKQQNPVVSMLIENYGNVQIELYPDMAPNTVANFIYLIKNNYYNGRTFNRVTPYLIQCGVENNEDYSIKGEFEANGYTNNTLKFERGTIGLARNDYSGFSEDIIKNGYDSGNSCFFILTQDSEEMYGLYAPFGKVILGMNIIDKISKLETIIDEDGIETEEPMICPVIKYMVVDTFGVDYPEPEKLEKFDVKEWFAQQYNY